MKNFIFKSADADLQKMFQYLETIRKNILYITYKVDSIDSLVKGIVHDKNLQKQVDEYFEDTAEDNSKDLD